MGYEIRMYTDGLHVYYCAFNEAEELVFTGYSIEDIREFIRREGITYATTGE